MLSVCKVRESGRAKHVSIKISVVGEVEVVVPVGFERTKLPALLEKRRGWIEKTRSRLINAAADTPEDWSAKKPETVSFRWQSDALEETAAAESWQIKYLKGQRDSPTGRLRQRTQCIPLTNHRVTVRGNIENIPACQAVLRKWLAHRAQEDLSPWLRQLGFDLDLPCRRISVRGQKTRWASCSSQKDISLNYKLLFLPRPLVHYVLVHELCHTVHMNHSKDFWQLVGQKQPDYKQWDKQLKTGWRYVPRWVES
ncbi:MAG: M48 family peptidase [Leptolyngbya foveolarum]|uniref:M48 family peptidase n=1 Tax=Leptolyngbya foveolarum TaxID=47253 RepID=A0A2W4TRH6_9CYAN|nr:MAG: M48 family peptidase [Leptolyngbya foveolarum]